MEFLSKYRHLSWVFLLIPIYVFLFVKLGAFHIRLWDEGWFVVHALRNARERILARSVLQWARGVLRE